MVEGAVNMHGECLLVVSAALYYLSDPILIGSNAINLCLFTFLQCNYSCMPRQKKEASTIILHLDTCLNYQ